MSKVFVLCSQNTEMKINLYLLLLKRILSKIKLSVFQVGGRCCFIENIKLKQLYQTFFSFPLYLFPINVVDVAEITLK